MGPADSRIIPRVPRYSGWRSASARFAYVAFTLYGQTVRSVPLARFLPLSRSFYPGRALTPPVWALPLSLAATRAIIFIFSSSGYLDVSIPRVRFSGVSRKWQRPLAVGFPHSDIGASMDICSSTPLFAAYRVLLRRRETRHPTYALLLLPLSLLFSLLLYFALLCTSCHRSSPPFFRRTWRITDSNR